MKNLFRTKLCFTPVFIILLVLSNVTQVDAQLVRVTKSNPDGDIIPDTLLADNCFGTLVPSSNELEFYILTRIPNVISIDLITIDSVPFYAQGVKVIEELVRQEGYPGKFEDYDYLWRVKYVFNNNLGSYSDGSDHYLDCDIQVTFGNENGIFRIADETLHKAEKDPKVEDSVLKNQDIPEGGVEVVSRRFQYCDYDNFSLGRLAVEEVFAVNKVYPNPVEDQLNIELESAKEQDISIQLINQLGTLVESISLESGKSKNLLNQIIDMSNLSSGVYYLSISTKDKSYIEKIVKF